jgi:hypothetical protein
MSVKRIDHVVLLPDAISGLVFTSARDDCGMIEKGDVGLKSIVLSSNQSSELSQRSEISKRLVSPRDFGIYFGLN